ncbi:MAG: Ig domain-containing protein [bacterium JZ-2024 1]
MRKERKKVKKAVFLLLLFVEVQSCMPGEWLVLSLSTGNVSTVMVGQSFSANILVWGGIPPFRVVWVGGFFPPGIVFLPSQFIIQGVATQPGVFRVVLEAWDARGFWVRRTFTFIVISSGTPVSLPEMHLPAATLGKPYQVSLFPGKEGNTGEWKLTAGKLPAGLELKKTGWITGIPEERGDFWFLASYEALSGEVVEYTYQLKVK